MNWDYHKFGSRKARRRFSSYGRARRYAERLVRSNDILAGEFHLVTVFKVDDLASRRKPVFTLHRPVESQWETCLEEK